MKKIITKEMRHNIMNELYKFLKFEASDPCKVLFYEINGVEYQPNMKLKRGMIHLEKISLLWNCSSTRRGAYRNHLMWLAFYKHYYGCIYKNHNGGYLIDSFKINDVMNKVKTDYREAIAYEDENGFSKTTNIYCMVG